MMSAVSFERLLVLGSTGQTALFESLMWFGAVLVLIGIGSGAIAAVRRRYRKRGALPGSGLTLEDLRRHHQSGRLTKEEYELLRKNILHTAGVDRPK